MTSPSIEWTAVTLECGERRRCPLPGVTDLYEARVLARSRGWRALRFEWSMDGAPAGAFDEPPSALDLGSG